MIELNVTRENRNGEEGFVVNGKLEGKPSDILEELAYACLDITKQLPGETPYNQAKFLAKLTVLCMHD